MPRRLLGGLLLAASLVLAGSSASLAATTPITSGEAIQAQPAGSIQVPIVGTGGTNAVATITDFRVIDGVLSAVGTITGAVAVAGGVVNVVDAPFTAPLTDISATCEILDLDLGPIHLDLLGLIVDVSEINVDITAQPGPGNLLGNLLCGVAGLLDRNGTLDQLERLLDRILRFL